MRKFLRCALSLLLIIGFVVGLAAFAKYLNEDITEKLTSDDESSTDTINEWQLCDDVSTLTVGDKIVIVVQSEECALSITQNPNNRDIASVTRKENTITFGDDVQIITLEAGIMENTFALNVGNGYLYAPSSSSNHLKTHEDVDENSSWSISNGANSTANIVAQGDSTRNVLLYNATNELFSCYSPDTTTQKSVSIYKLVEVEKNK